MKFSILISIVLAEICPSFRKNSPWNTLKINFDSSYETYNGNCPLNRITRKNILLKRSPINPGVFDHEYSSTDFHDESDDDTTNELNYETITKSEDATANEFYYDEDVTIGIKDLNSAVYDTIKECTADGGRCSIPIMENDSVDDDTIEDIKKIHESVKLTCGDSLEPFKCVEKLNVNARKEMDAQSTTLGKTKGKEILNLSCIQNLWT
jgi:hypothetical protein